LVAAHPTLVAFEVIGHSLEGRDIVNLRISSDLKNSASKPGISFMGTHHAREHVSTEMPLNLAQYLLTEYVKGNPQIVNLVDNREINIIPLVNPDGAEYDVAGGQYEGWRKNRRKNADGTYGVDLNRNYGYNWGQGGASPSPGSDTYRGTAAFSEPETQVIKNFIDSKSNVTELLTFHTYSELILFPWGYTYSGITDVKDHQVFQTMANTMAGWNKYTPEQSSQLYITSGDTTDWAYGTHKIFAFTFELDPANAWGIGGFYPGQATIPVVFQKNLMPCLYMIDLADNPYRVIKSHSETFGMNTPLLN
jgi:carboxypeptidase T